MSANTGVAPAVTTAAAVAAKVSDGTITSSPADTPAAARARCRAAVPLETAIAWPTPSQRPNPASKAST